MSDAALFAQIDALVAQIAAAGWKERDALKAQLLELITAAPNRASAQAHLEEARKGLALEARWEIDEVLEDLAPPPAAPAPEPEPEPEDPNRPLRQSDLVMVYDDPRGIRLQTTKKGERWFLTQPDPYSGRPQMIELLPDEVKQVKQQLQGSPYWVPGSGML